MENIVEKNKRTLLYLSSNFFELPMYRLKALSFDLIITLKKDHGMVHKKYEIIFSESLQILTWEVETDEKKIELDQNLTNNKKSTIFELSSWNLVKLTRPWGGLFDQVSWW